MIVKKSKTEISAKILKRKKQSFYDQNHTKNYPAHVQDKVFTLNQTWNKYI